MNKFDVIVVGGGLIGMLSARELAGQGLSVAVVERNEAGRESSWAGGGILSPLYPWRYPDAVNALASWSQQVYPQLLDTIYIESEIDPEYQRSGLLVLDTGEKAEAENWATKWGVDLQYVESAKLHQLESRLSTQALAGLWMPEIGQVRNPRLAQSLKKSIINQGITLFENSPVEKLLIEDHVVHGVQLAAGKLQSNKVVIAGGAWSAQILVETGIELPVKPIRGQMILFKAEPGLVSHIVLSQDRYVIPRQDGRILVGSTLEDVGFEKLTTEQARDELYTEALRLVPDLENYPVEHHWAGLRPASPDGIPFISDHPSISGLFINTGHYRNGVVLGPASCRLLRNLVMGETAIVDPHPYAISLK
ncbi:MAG: glycine oxidase ThiO [Gammaproteobacteria bacterium]